MAKVSRRKFLRNGGRAVLGAALARATAGQAAGGGRKKKPNILLLLSDEHTVAGLAAYGNPHIATPHLDYLAKHGVRFTKSYCTSPLCSPARASIHTGRMPHVTGVNNNQTGGMDWSLPNMGDAVRKAGYNTAWVGKLHLGGKKKGDATAPVPPGYKKATGMMWGYYPTAPDGIPGFENLNYTGVMKEYAKKPPTFASYNLGLEVDPPVVEEAVEYLKREHDKPFFLAVSIMNPHDICFWPGKPMKKMVGEVPKIPKNLKDLPPLPANHAIPKNEAEWVADRRNRNAKLNADNPAWRRYLHAYKYFVEHLDDSVGRIMKTLKEQGLEEDTVVIYTSDHGEGVAGHKWRNKLGPYEEEVAVPFSVTWKGNTPAGIVDETHLISGLDIFPTVCAYAGARTPESLEGIDVKELIENPARRGRDMLVVELGTFGGRAEDWNSGGIGRVIRTGQYKYMRFDTKEEMLFDMNNDPGEMDNLAPRKEYAAILKQHRALLTRYVKATGDHFKMEGHKREKPQDKFPDEDQKSDEPTRLTGHRGYPDRPDGTEELSSFSCPLNFGDNYGTRVRGYVAAPVTGEYFFFLNCANAGQLWLSVDARPEKRQKIASVIAGVERGKWKSQKRSTSAPIKLQKGKKYYIEALHHAGKGQDHLAVAWWNKEMGWQAPIPGSHLSTPDGKKGRILREFWRAR